MKNNYIYDDIMLFYDVIFDGSAIWVVVFFCPWYYVIGTIVLVNVTDRLQN